MFILKNKKQLQKGLAKCRALPVKPKVHVARFGHYLVRGANDYFVSIKKDERGLRQVSCECPAGERGIPCYHAAAACIAHSFYAQYAPNVKQSPEMELFLQFRKAMETWR